MEIKNMIESIEFFNIYLGKNSLFGFSILEVWNTPLFSCRMDRASDIFRIVLFFNFEICIYKHPIWWEEDGNFYILKTEKVEIINLRKMNKFYADPSPCPCGKTRDSFRCRIH
jgi:hypothetical protein